MKNNTVADNQVNKKEIICSDGNCPVTATMNIIGGKWKIVLINRIYSDSPARFGALKRSLKNISQSMLTTQLRELEEAGIIHRKIFAEVPPKVEYTLTELGMSLKPIIMEMSTWGKKYVQGKKETEESKISV